MPLAFAIADAMMARPRRTASAATLEGIESERLPRFPERALPLTGRVRRHPLAAVAFAVLTLLVLLAPWRVPMSSDGLLMLRTGIAIAFDGTFRLPNAPPGARYDPIYLRPAPGGRGVVSIYPPFGALWRAAALRGAMAVPAGEIRGRLADAVLGLVPLLMTAGAVFPLARLLRYGGVGRRHAAPLAGALVVGTFLGPLGLLDFSEPAVILVASAALERSLAARRLRGRRRTGAMAAGAAIAAAGLVVKPAMVILAPALLLAAAFPRRGEPRVRSMAVACLAALPGLALWLGLNAAMYGSALETGLSTRTANPLARPVGLWWTLLRLTVLPNRGLLWYAPLLLLALPAARGRRRTQPDRRLDRLAGALGAGAFLAVNLSWFAWEGGFGWGPRLSAPAVALAATLLGPGARSRRRVAVLAAAGVLINLPGYLLDVSRLYQVASTAPGAVDPLGPVVPIHREDGGRGGLYPLQRLHYVPSRAPVFTGWRTLVELAAHGDGPNAGKQGDREDRDALALRLARGGSVFPRPPDVATALLQEAAVSAEVEPPRARRLLAVARDFGAGD